MKKFQIVEIAENNHHAGSKANNDVMEIALTQGYQSLELRSRTDVKSFYGKISRQIGYVIDWLKVYNHIETGSIVLLQHPFHTPHLIRNQTLHALKNKKQVKIISIVHDVELLRGYRYNAYYEQEFKVMLEVADVIVVHNEIMREFFVDQGYPETQLITLEIFDYLVDDAERLLFKQVSCEKSINIAGNLDSQKANYLSQLNSLPFKIHLYGPNYTEGSDNSANIHYHGSLKPEEVPHYLNRGFGLVWDGESIQGCEGASGNYLRYNNPHKLSLYLASGLPVIIWKQAAEARLVAKHNIGYAVETLEEAAAIMEELTIEQYQSLLSNVTDIQKKLVKGHYTTQALLSAERRVEGG